jgi:chemotaxis family two-component system response regulator Rcp1
VERSDVAPSGSQGEACGRKMNNASDRPIVILLVEDDVGEARLTEHALRKGGIRGDLYHVRDGVEAIRFLRREAEYGGAPLPELVLLDLDLPRKDGREVLAEVKGDPELRLVPVVILSTSGVERDVAETYGLHANAYVVKPVDLDRFVQVARAIKDFWFSTARLPSRG